MVRDRDCGLFVNSPITLIAHKNSAFLLELSSRAILRELNFLILKKKGG